MGSQSAAISQLCGERHLWGLVVHDKLNLLGGAGTPLVPAPEIERGRRPLSEHPVRVLRQMTPGELVWRGQ